MLYQTKMISRGRITIPKEIRDILKLEGGEKLEVELERKEKEIRLKMAPDIIVKKIK